MAAACADHCQCPIRTRRIEGSSNVTAPGARGAVRTTRAGDPTTSGLQGTTPSSPTTGFRRTLKPGTASLQQLASIKSSTASACVLPYAASIPSGCLGRVVREDEPPGGLAGVSRSWFMLAGSTTSACDTPDYHVLIRGGPGAATYSLNSATRQRPGSDRAVVKAA